MDKFKKFVKRFVSPDLPMRLCVFNMMSAIGFVGGLVSIIITYAMHINNGQIISMAVALSMLVFLVYLANAKNMLNLAAILLCIVIGWAVFPHMFIKGGGIYSGMPLWFVLVIVFETILIEGKAKFIIGGITVAIYTGMFYFAYAFPEKLHYFGDDKMVFMDIAQSYVFVAICTFVILAFELFLYNIAIKRAAENAKEAEKAKSEAINANAAKSTFLANMSHEIRTPMGVILGMNEMIQRESKEQEIIEYSKDIMGAANSLLSIINDILDFSKIESGKMNIVENEYNFKNMIQDLITMFRVKEQETGIKFRVKYDKELPLTLFGDDLRIKQCLINILSNAFKYTEKGSVNFEISGETDGEYKKITFSVKDTGIGIKEDEMNRLFDSFERLDENHNKTIQGTGLGLNITSSLLTLMGSQLKVESTYGEGSRFYFTISQKIIGSETIISSMKNATDNVINDKKEYFVAENANVLVVDDNLVNIKVFTALLKNSKMKIDTALSGMEAIEKVKENKYDIIFLDHMMPEMDGEVTFIKMKEDNYIQDTPVIMLTANAISGMKEHFMDMGFAGYLSKPIDYDLLDKILRKYLTKE